MNWQHVASEIKENLKQRKQSYESMKKIDIAEIDLFGTVEFQEHGRWGVDRSGWVRTNKGDIRFYVDCGKVFFIHKIFQISREHEAFLNKRILVCVQEKHKVEELIGELYWLTQYVE